MNIDLTPELYWLTLTLLMTGLFWVPYILNRMKEQGIFPAIWNPDPDKRPKAQWAERMMRAHENAIENLVIFAPLVLLVHVTGTSSGITLLACKVYFFVRAAHYLLYSFRVPLFRTLAFLIGFCAQITLVLAVLSAFN